VSAKAGSLNWNRDDAEIQNTHRGGGCAHADPRRQHGAGGRRARPRGANDSARACFTADNTGTRRTTHNACARRTIRCTLARRRHDVTEP